MNRPGVVRLMSLVVGNVLDDEAIEDLHRGLSDSQLVWMFNEVIVEHSYQLGDRIKADIERKAQELGFWITWR